MQTFIHVNTSERSEKRLHNIISSFHPQSKIGFSKNVNPFFLKIKIFFLILLCPSAEIISPGIPIVCDSWPHFAWTKCSRVSLTRKPDYVTTLMQIFKKDLTLYELESEVPNLPYGFPTLFYFETFFPRRDLHTLHICQFTQSKYGKSLINIQETLLINFFFFWKTNIN